MYSDFKGLILKDALLIMGGFYPFQGISLNPTRMYVIIVPFFVLAVEVMAIKIRENKNLNGLEITPDGNRNTFKICTLFLQSKRDVTLAINLIKIVGTF